jgi:hypothetical protein
MTAICDAANTSERTGRPAATTIRSARYAIERAGPADGPATIPTESKAVSGTAFAPIPRQVARRSSSNLIYTGNRRTARWLATRPIPFEPKTILGWQAERQGAKQHVPFRDVGHQNIGGLFDAIGKAGEF